MQNVNKVNKAGGIQSNFHQLVDIAEVSVDASLPKEERVADFMRQIHDPYHFRCGDCTVTAKFTQDGPSLEDCILRLMV